MSEDQTLPPRQPNSPRVWLRRAWGWLLAHPIVAAALGGLAAGLLLPQVARWVF